MVRSEQSRRLKVRRHWVYRRQLLSYVTNVDDLKSRSIYQRPYRVTLRAQQVCPWDRIRPPRFSINYNLSSPTTSRSDDDCVIVRFLSWYRIKNPSAPTKKRQPPEKQKRMPIRTSLTCGRLVSAPPVKIRNPKIEDSRHIY